MLGQFRIFIFLFAITHLLYEFLSSRNWVCPRCNRPNIERLPDPAYASRSVSEVNVFETEGFFISLEVISAQPSQSEAPVSERRANWDGAEGANRLESDDTTSVVASHYSSASGASTSSQKFWMSMLARHIFAVCLPMLLFVFGFALVCGCLFG